MSTAERHQALRQALVTAGERVISTSGLASLKARDLARETGCALGAIYTVFPDLNGIVLAANARTLEAVDAAICAALALGNDSSTPIEQLEVLAITYLDYAVCNRQRWNALFAHSLPDGQQVPEAYLNLQARLFQYVEAPLSALDPGLATAELALAAKTVFSAVHGVISLGLDEKLTPTPVKVLRRQVRLLVRAIALGLPASIGHLASHTDNIAAAAT